MSMKSSGLLVAMNNLPKNSIILLFTDEPTAGLDLESEVIRLRDQKKMRVNIEKRKLEVLGDAVTALKAVANQEENPKEDNASR